MFKLMCVTNRHLCKTEFLKQIEKLAQYASSERAALSGQEALDQISLSAFILREKDLSRTEYKQLAVRVMDICRRYRVLCILHNFVDVAIELEAKAIHLPMPVLRQLSLEQKQSFTTLGASCHSAEEAKEAEALGCTYITAGHIFSTDCKKGVPPRGLDFLKEVCQSVQIPVFAIGGIHIDNIQEIKQAGAEGACIMSGFMTCDNL